MGAVVCAWLAFRVLTFTSKNIHAGIKLLLNIEYKAHISRQ